MHFVGLTDRTAVCGPACTVVWQGRVGDHSPYADCAAARGSQKLTARDAKKLREGRKEEQFGELAGFAGLGLNLQICFGLLSLEQLRPLAGGGGQGFPGGLVRRARSQPGLRAGR
jgi:hypothetical protein